jgi:hypothetical protein
MADRSIRALLLLAALVTVDPVDAQECGASFDSTFDMIQKVIFEGRGCAANECHGAAESGGLRLTGDVAYDELVDQPPETVSPDIVLGLKRVSPAKKAQSLLWLNVAGAVFPEQWRAPLRTMPSGGLPPLTLDELEVLRLWIEEGAPRDETVPGTADLLDACLPKPRPVEVQPLLPPPVERGIQFRAPRQFIAANSERETCFVSYYDVTDRVPRLYWAPDGEHFRIKRIEERQDPLSHHAIVNSYAGTADIHDPSWGSFTCKGGPLDGAACEPTDTDACGDGWVCGSEPVDSVTCIGFGPGDAGVGAAEGSLFSTMESALAGQGVYRSVPLKGILVWNSHAFNVFDDDAKLDIWVNVEYAEPEEQIHELRKFTDFSRIFIMNPPAYGADEVCHHYVAPRGMNLITLNSHMHKRGQRFRIWDGPFRCEGGANAGAACVPEGPDVDFPVEDLCAGAPCVAYVSPDIGDCDGDLRVSVADLTLGVNLALDRSPVDHCSRFDPDGDGRVLVSDLITAVRALLAPRYRDADESLIYVTLSYADPWVLTYDPPRVLDQEAAGERTFTYCALYDNGFTNPSEVKRVSTSPPRSACVATHCAEGAVGGLCVGGTQAERDASCDSVSGAGDGFCDACTAGSGLTSDDEMFVLLGAFYMAPGR